MNILIEKETDKELDFNYEEVIRKVIEYSIDYLNCPYEIEVNVLLTDNQKICQVNKEFRNIDRPTDVLSFPMVEYDIPSNFSILEEDESLCDCFNPETGELLLGDIMVSLEKVKEQASEYGHSEIRELGFLIAHSMLHLCGFDHVDEDERAVMEKKQEEILNNLKIYR
jgi:probable rRNA maturation factor